MRNEELKVREVIGSGVISTREAAITILKLANEQNWIKIIDFNQIEFASRSFIHQLTSDLKDLANKGRKIELINLSYSIKRMIEVVKNSVSKSRLLDSNDLTSAEPISLSDLS